VPAARAQKRPAGSRMPIQITDADGFSGGELQVGDYGTVMEMVPRFTVAPEDWACKAN
jgi:hypothetical protein